MSAGFTPGPWTLVRVNDSVPWLHVYCGDSKALWHVDRSDDEKMANSRLIAAAPALYEACQRAKQFIQNGVEFGFIRMPEAETPDSAHGTLPAILAALAKARGE